MNIKLILLGGIAFFVGMWVIGFISGPVLHEGLLAATYDEYASFWRPELNAEPPDMAGLLPRWIIGGLISAFILAAVYGWIRPAFSGAGWLRGAKYGIALFLVALTGMIGWSGIFNLPDWLWGVWTIETFFSYLVGGIALGWTAEKFAASPAPA